jgi:hypothetical protein
MSLSGVFAVLSGRVPNFYDAIAGPIGLWLLLSELRDALSMSKKLDKALEDSRVSVWWDNDKFTEYLAVSQLLWRNESGPARWRHAERD